MKIGIDARLYGTKHRGIGRYSQKLIENLEKIDQKNQYVVFLSKDNFFDFKPQNKNFKKVLVDSRVYSWQEQILFPLMLKKYKFDFIHFFHFNVPFFYRQRFIVTIHDLIISHYPSSRATTLNPLLYKIKLFFYQLIVKSTVRRAQKIIAISEFTKNDIVRLLKADDKKIQVIYEGIGTLKETTADCQMVLDNLSIKNKYLLYVGSAYPHKNLSKLLFVLAEMIKSRPDLKLVLVGEINYFYKQIKNEIKNLDLELNVILTDYINDDKLVCLYKKAEAYVFPSLIEGFGLPPLEAQNYNLPVISSNSSCLPEILGQSAIYFNPEDSIEMLEKINLLLDDEKLRQELIIKGRENIKKYSWQKCAEETLDIYNIFDLN